MRQKNNSVNRNSFHLAFWGEKLLGTRNCVTSKYLHNRILPNFPRNRKGDIFQGDATSEG